MKRAVFVIAEENFRDEELLQPMEMLKKKGVECVIASKKRGHCIGSLGVGVEATLALSEVGNDFDAIVFVGGSGARQYFHDAEALGLARKYYDLGRVVAAICFGPVILANAGILMGKNATAFASEKRDFVGKCAKFTGRSVEIVGKIIMASGPSFAPAFGEEIAKKLE